MAKPARVSTAVLMRFVGLLLLLALANTRGVAAKPRMDDCKKS